MAEIMLLDAENIFRAGYASGHMLQTSGGVKTGGIFNFLRSLDSYMKEFDPTHVIIAWESYPTWRHEVFPEYKIQREMPPPGIAIQRGIVRQFLSNLPVVQLKVDEWEADDIAGYFRGRITYSKEEHVGYFVSNDEDWLQLVGSKISLYMPRNKRLVTPKNFQKWAKATDPSMFIKMKALMGDPGDGIFGMKGVGVVGAFNYWAQVETDPVKNALIREYTLGDEFKRNLELVDLIGLNERKKGWFEQHHSAKHGSLNIVELERMFQEYEFNSFVKKLDEYVDRYRPLSTESPE